MLRKFSFLLWVRRERLIIWDRFNSIYSFELSKVRIILVLLKGSVEIFFPYKIFLIIILLVSFKSVKNKLFKVNLYLFLLEIFVLLCFCLLYFLFVFYCRDLRFKLIWKNFETLRVLIRLKSFWVLFRVVMTWNFIRMPHTHNLIIDSLWSLKFISWGFTTGNLHVVIYFLWVVNNVAVSSFDLFDILFWLDTHFLVLLLRSNKLILNEVLRNVWSYSLMMLLTFEWSMILSLRLLDLLITTVYHWSLSFTSSSSKLTEQLVLSKTTSLDRLLIHVDDFRFEYRVWR